VAEPGADAKAAPFSRLFAGVGIAILLVVWTGASLSSGGTFVPAPWTTVADTAVLLSRGYAWTQILTTTVRVCIGFLAGLAVGVAVGVSAGRPRLASVLRPIVHFFQGMPPLLWAIPLVALMGVGHLPSILVIGLITFPLVAVTVGEGMATLPREYAEMLTVFAPGVAPRMRELVFPHLRPFLGASVKAGLVLAVKASVTAEYFGATTGIGFQIQSAYMSLRIRSLFSWALILILIILAFTYLLPQVRLLRRLVSGRTGARARQRAAVAASPWPQRRPPEAPGARRIVLRGVGFSWRGKDKLLEGVSLAVTGKSIMLISGDSGTGKTTLLRLAASLLPPSEGTIERPGRLGFVFQDDRLLPWRSIEENVALPIRSGGRPRRAALQEARRLLADVGLAGQETKMPAELSGGMKKRAALARCFARDPDAVLLDEPFSGLHAEARRGLWKAFLQFHARRPIPAIVVTHYPEELSAQADCTLRTLAGRPARLSSRRR